MPSINKICEDAICAISLSITKGVFEISLYIAKEIQEVANYK